MTLKQPMHRNDDINQHTYPWIMNRKRDVKDTRILFNMWVSFLTATKLYEHKLIKKKLCRYLPLSYSKAVFK